MNLIPVERVIVSAERQRKEFKAEALQELAESLSRIGQIQPIVLDDQDNLIAGERRLRAAKSLGWAEIKFTRFSALSPIEASIVELEENLKRENLTWQEQVDAVAKLHLLMSQQSDDWTAEKTAKAIGVSPSTVSRLLTINSAAAQDPKILESSGPAAAYNFLSRQQSRVIDAELAKLSAVEEDSPPSGPTGAVEGEGSSPPSVAPVQEILQGDFIEWAEKYSGPKFNLIHCDFPYGVEMGSSNLQSSAGHWEKYDDSINTYIKLCNALCRLQDRFVAPTAHMVFWFSMNYYEATKLKLEDSGWKVDPFPLVWLKSDNKGLLPDPQRGPRRIYETALLCSRGDRKIVRPVSNAFAESTNKFEAMHISEKPVSVVKHFLSMLCDSTSSFLDPTCGAGSAVLAAKELGAEHVLGIELSPTHAENAKLRIAKSVSIAGLLGE